MVDDLNRMIRGVGELLQPGAGEPGLSSGGPPRGPAAASVALSEAQGEVRGNGALPGREAVAAVRPHLPGDEDHELSVGEGMIPTESRMLENSTSGLMSGGEEYRRRGGPGGRWWESALC